MAVVYIRKKKQQVNEDDTQQQNSQEQNTAQQAKPVDQNKIIQINNQIVNINNQIQRAEEDFNNKVENLKRQKIRLQQQLVDAGGSLKTDESFRPKYKSFSKNLYESLQMNKAELLVAVIKDTFKDLGDMSYTFSDSSSLRLARRIITYLNSQNWNDGRNHWDEVAENIREFLSRGTVSFSRREIDDFVNMLAENLKEDPTFSWIFGNERYR